MVFLHLGSFIELNTSCSRWHDPIRIHQCCFIERSFLVVSWSRNYIKLLSVVKYMYVSRCFEPSC